MWTMEIPVISSAHITRETERELKNMADLDLQADVPGVITAAAMPTGFFVRFDGDKEPGRMSENIATLRTWAMANSPSYWVRIDADGDDVADLPSVWKD